MSPFPPLLGGTIPVALVVAVRAKRGLTPVCQCVHTVCCCVCQWPLGQAQCASGCDPLRPRASSGNERVTGSRWRKWTRLTEVFNASVVISIFLQNRRNVYITPESELLLLKTSTFQFDSNFHFHLAKMLSAKTHLKCVLCLPPTAPPNCLSPG